MTDVKPSPERAASRGRRREFARRFVLFVILLAIIASAASLVRLGAVLAATPRAAWLEEVPTLTSQPASDPEVAARAAWLARFIDDPAFVMARLPECQSLAASAADRARCVDIIDDGLRPLPASGELWLARAVALLQSGSFGDGPFDALRLSYRFAPKEGWIASSRVVTALRLYPLLPDDLKKDAVDDLNLILTYDFTQPLVDAYVGDPTLRNAAQDALQGLDAKRLGFFLYKIRQKTGMPG